MFGCAVLGEAYFGDVCAGESVTPSPTGGAWYPLRRRIGPDGHEIPEDEFALLLALGYVD